MFNDCESMINLLLKEPKNPRNNVSHIVKKYLLVFILSCLQKIRLYLFKDGNIKEKVEISTILIIRLPELINLYINNQDLLYYLIQIPKVFDLFENMLSINQNNLDLFLKHIELIIRNGTDRNLLTECAKCMAFMCTNNSISQTCNAFKTIILKEHINIFMKSMLRFQNEDSDNNSMKILYLCIKRISVLSEEVGFFNLNVANNTFKLLNLFMKDRRYDFDFDDLIKLLQNLCFFGLQQCVDLKKKNLSNVKQLFKDFFNICIKSLNQEDNLISNKAFNIFYDSIFILNDRYGYQIQKMGFIDYFGKTEQICKFILNYMVINETQFEFEKKINLIMTELDNHFILTENLQKNMELKVYNTFRKELMGQPLSIEDHEENDDLIVLDEESNVVNKENNRSVKKLIDFYSKIDCAKKRKQRETNSFLTSTRIENQKLSKNQFFFKSKRKRLETNDSAYDSFNNTL
jgi:hypothetical protein